MRILTLLLLLAAGAAHAKPPAAEWAPPDKLIDEYNRAVDALNAGNPAEAERIVSKIVAKAPDCGLALVMLGQARTRLNRPQDALEPLQHAVELFPDESEAHGALAESAFGAQQFQVAETASGRAAELAPTDPVAAAFAVQASLRLGHAEEAVKRLARAQIGDADRACIHTLLLAETGDTAAAVERFAACDATAEPGIRSMAEAEHAIAVGGGQEALKKSARELGIAGYDLVARGAELVGAGRHAEALPVLEAALVAFPKDVSVRMNLAHAFLELERYKEAEATLGEILASDTWVDVHASGGMSGIVTKRGEDWMRETQRDAAALLVRVQARASRFGPATKTLADARKRFGDAIELVVAEAELSAEDGRPADAWALLRAAAAREAGNADLAGAIAWLSVDAPSGLDPGMVAYVRAHGETIDRLNLAFGESNGGDHAGCLEDAEAVLAKDPKAPRAAEVGYACAVRAELVDRAYPILVQLGTGADRRVVHDHALALQHKDRHAEALSLLALYPADGEMEPKLRALALRSHVALEQWPEVVTLAAKPGLDPQFQAWVGQELAQAERRNDAARVLGDACPRLSGKDADTCKELLEWVAKP